MYKVSVIVPVYNDEAYISECLNSILRQSYSNLQILVINDGSTDKSEEIIKKIAEKDFRIEYYHKENSGLSDARNLGLEKATGDFLTFVDSDDRLERCAIEKLLFTSLKDQSDIVIGKIKRIYEQKETYLQKHFKFEGYIPISGVRISKIPEYMMMVANSACAKLFKMSMLKQCKVNFPSGLNYEDMVFTFKLFSYDPVISTVGEEIYYYRIHPRTIMTTENDKIYDIFECYDLLRQFYEDSSLAERFKEELQYLFIHHILIGSVYRGIQSGMFSAMKMIKAIRTYIVKRNIRWHDCRYIKNYSVFIRIYLSVMFILVRG